METELIKVIVLSGMLLLGTTACNENKERPVEPLVYENESGLEVNTADNDVELENFKTDAETRIDDNDRKIKELEERKREAKKETNEEYNQRIADLKERNSKLRARVKEYKKDGNQKWEDFKREFNHDMDEFGKAIENFATNNRK